MDAFQSTYASLATLQCSACTALSGYPGPSQCRIVSQTLWSGICGVKKIIVAINFKQSYLKIHSTDLNSLDLFRDLIHGIVYLRFNCKAFTADLTHTKATIIITKHAIKTLFIKCDRLWEKSPLANMHMHLLLQSAIVMNVKTDH